MFSRLPAGVRECQDESGLRTSAAATTQEQTRGRESGRIPVTACSGSDSINELIPHKIHENQEGLSSYLTTWKSFFASHQGWLKEILRQAAVPFDLPFFVIFICSLSSEGRTSWLRKGDTSRQGAGGGGRIRERKRKPRDEKMKCEWRWSPGTPAR